jgi:hypothetical protein
VFVVYALINCCVPIGKAGSDLPCLVIGYIVK